MANVIQNSSGNAISLLGSTGSIGRQTLEVAELLGIQVCALSADKNIELLEKQTRRFNYQMQLFINEKNLFFGFSKLP